MGAVLVALLVLPMAAGLLGGLWRPLVGVVGAALAFGAAVVLAVDLLRSGSTSVGLTSAGWTRAGGGLVAGFATDRVSVVLALLVLGVSTLVQAFARRYLSGDLRAGWFCGWAGVLTSASAGLVTSATLLTLAACWTVAGIALCALLATYPHLPAARVGVLRTARTFLLGDLALWAAVVTVSLRWGSIDLRGLDASRTAGHPVLLSVVACAVVLAALTRSAQVPTHSWLRATLAAPTPVSALLHAGVVNAGGILLVKLGVILSAAPVAGALAFLAGAVTALWGTAQMLTKPDVKGALAHSTMGQMGFMIMTCGLGLYALAVFHLVAHGMYKATLFLSSGRAVHAARVRAAAPVARPGRSLRVGMAVPIVVVPALALGLGAVFDPDVGAGAATEVLLVFAWASAVAAGLAWARRYPTLRGIVVAAGFSAVAALVYLLWVRAVSAFLEPALPASTPLAGAPWLLLAAALVLVGASVLCLRPVGGAGRLGSLQRTLYVTTLRAGHVHPSPRSAAPARWPARRHRGHRSAVAPGLVPVRLQDAPVPVGARR